MTPAERLHEAITQYVGALSEGDFKALVAAARPPVDPPNDNETPARPQTPADALEAVRRRHGRILGQEVAH